MTKPKAAEDLSVGKFALSPGNCNVPPCDIEKAKATSQCDQFYIAHPPDDGSDAYRLARRARLASQRKDELAAISLADAAIHQALQTDAKHIAAWALCTKSVSSAIVGLRAEALQLGGEALHIAEDIGDQALEARALFSISYVALETNEQAKAQKLLERSLICATNAKSDYDLFWALNNLSHVYGEQLEALQENGTAFAQKNALKLLFATAMQALETATRIDVAGPKCYALLNLANAFMLDKNYVRAKDLIEKYAGIAQAEQDHRLMAYANLDRARLCEALGQDQNAIDWLSTQEHFETLCKTDDLKLSTTEALARLHRRNGQIEIAYDNLCAAREIERKIYSFQAERHLGVLSARIEMQETRAKAERFRAEAETLEIRNLLLEQERENLRRKAMLDPLTQLGNRRAADATFEALITAAQEGRGGFQVVYIDVDHFKKVNDTLGHPVGDKVLIQIANLLRQGTRQTDEVFRFGGEEFVMILKNSEPQFGMETCLRLKDIIMQWDWSSIANDLSITASFGLTLWQGETHQADVMARADQALYSAKETGRNKVVMLSG